LGFKNKNMAEINTHFVFDGKKINISPDLYSVFNFLMEIEKEIESLLSFREQHSEMKDFIKFLMEKLKENDIKFNYSGFRKGSKLIENGFIFHIPLRCQMIALFANLEVLFFLHLAYEKETDDEDKIIKYARDDKNVKKFINKFLLNEENIYYKSNKPRMSSITAKKVRKLRNSLTHFFSLSSEEAGLSIAPSMLDEKTRKIEELFKKNKLGTLTHISEKDLYELIKSAGLLRIKKWDEDFRIAPMDFKRKINFVKNLVEKYGVVVITEENIKIK